MLWRQPHDVFPSWYMETSKVRKFWTSNPFYPELSGALVTFYTIVIFVCSRVFLIWIPLPSPPPYIFEVWGFFFWGGGFFFFFFLSFLPFLPIRWDPKETKLHKANPKGKKYIFIISVFCCFFFFLPTPLFFLLVLIISGHLKKKNECAAEIPSLVLIRNSWLDKTSKGDIR